MKRIIIIPEEKYGFYLKSISEEDIEHIRNWKNDNRRSFFYQGIISREQQKIWFDQYCSRENDYIFMVMSESNVGIGCLGFRKKDEEIDIYNVLRGVRNTPCISIHDAMHALIAYISQKYSMHIKCDVLKDNPAVGWYKKCGFDILEEKEYYVMEANSDKIPAIKIIVEER